MNTVTRTSSTPEKTRVEDLEGGSLVMCRAYDGKEEVYAVLGYKQNYAGIMAVSLTNGGFLASGTLVTSLKKGEKVTITVGGAE